MQGELKLALRNGISNDGETVETQNFASLQDGHINWYALTTAQIAQLQAISERNTGRASVMAKGVLCFFFGICYEDEWDNAGVFDTPQQGGTATLTMKSIPAGVYVLRVKDGDGKEYHQKIVKK